MSTHQLLDTHRILLTAPRGYWANLPGDNSCDAGQNLRDAVELIAPHSDVVLVVGSDDSQFLLEVARQYGAGSAHLIGGAADLRDEWLPPDGIIGVTFDASTPVALVRELLGTLAGHGYTDIENITTADGRAGS